MNCSHNYSICKCLKSKSGLNDSECEKGCMTKYQNKIMSDSYVGIFAGELWWVEKIRRRKSGWFLWQLC